MNIEVSVLSERNGLPSEDIITGFKVIHSRPRWTKKVILQP